MEPDDPVKQQTIEAAPAAIETVRDQDKIMLVLAYLGILALIPLLTVKDSEYVRWHARTGFALGLLGALLSALSPVVGCLICPAFPALLAVDVYAMYRALKGDRWRIPLISDLADKF